MKIKEVIVLSFQNGTTFTPLLLTYENVVMYLQIDLQGCALFDEDSKEPLYRIQEPLLLTQAIMTDSKTVHLVVLKTNGELCYTLISGPGIPQTTLISRLDVRSTIYRQLVLLPQGNTIHIFYAYAHQTTPQLWRIEHRFWDHSSWQNVHLAELVHAPEPFYQVNLDREGNIHLLTITTQGQDSLFFTNRFNVAFHIWSSPRETFKISGEVVDMDALMTSANVHHLFWVVKATHGQFELRSALQEDAHELTSTWHALPDPIDTFDTCVKSIGTLEINGVLWLLALTKEEVLLQNYGKGWELFSSSPPVHRSLQWVHKGDGNSHQIYWLEDQIERRAPAYYRELGLTIIKHDTPPQDMVQPELDQVPPQTPPPVPAFYPDISPPHEQENTNLTPILNNLLSKFDQILEIISKNIILSKQDTPPSAPQEESVPAQTLEAPVEVINAFKETLSNLEKENQTLSQALRMMLSKQEENDCSINKLELQICQLQVEKEDVRPKGSLWNKWFS
ncbi:MAG TPA: hypothetical protein VFC84_05420 [Desulfosporosinus sp.]|nr:hypothetical protein [Desulfosporosinus sp.]